MTDRTRPAIRKPPSVAELFGRAEPKPEDAPICIRCRGPSGDGWINNVRLCPGCFDDYLASPEQHDMSLGARRAFVMWLDRAKR